MMCSCGQEHPEFDAVLERMQVEETVIVCMTIPPLHAWRVPRVFVFAHRVNAHDLPSLAERYGWIRER